MLAPGPVRLAPVRHRAGRTRPSSRSSASNGSGASGCRARTAGSAPSDTRADQRRQSARPRSRRSERRRTTSSSRRRPASADRQAGQGAAALDRRPARFLRAGVPRQDGHGAGHGHLLLVHADAHRQRSRFLRRTLRRRPPVHARHGRGRGARRLSGLAAASSRPSRELSQPTRLRTAEPMPAIGEGMRACSSATDDADNGGEHPMVDVTHRPERRSRRPKSTDVELYHPQSWWTKYVFSPGRQGHRHPVFGHRARDRAGRAGAVLADAAAARLSRHLRLHRRRMPTTSSSPCTA